MQFSKIHRQNLHDFWAKNKINFSPQNFKMPKKTSFIFLGNYVKNYSHRISVSMQNNEACFYFAGNLNSPQKKIPEKEILAAIAEKGFLQKENPVVQFFLELWKNEI